MDRTLEITSRPFLHHVYRCRCKTTLCEQVHDEAHILNISSGSNSRRGTFFGRRRKQAPLLHSIVTILMSRPAVVRPPYDYLFRFHMLGDSGVGKSCLMTQLTEAKFTAVHDTTIGVEFGTFQLCIGGTNVKLQIWDLPGHESFRSISRTYYRGAVGVLLVFDVTKRESFEHLSGFLSDATRYNNTRASIIVVSTKCDRDDLREVTEEEAKRFVTQHNLAGYVETSAKTDVKVEECFEATARHVVDRIRSGHLNHPAVSHSLQIATQPPATALGRATELAALIAAMFLSLLQSMIVTIVRCFGVFSRGGETGSIAS
jgi:Ras-related protein Rab-2A